MPRLIDADKLITVIQGTVSQVALDAPYDPEWFTRLAARQFEILAIIDDAPTIDAVPVVRCKNCEYYNPKYERCELHSKHHDIMYSGHDVKMKPDDFCSYGGDCR